MKKIFLGIISLVLSLGVLKTLAAETPTISTPAQTDCNTEPLGAVPVADLPALLANAHGNSSANRLASAQALGWVPSKKSVCGGYFADPYIPGSSAVLPPLKSTPVTLTGDSAQLLYSGVSHVEGNVVINQPGRVITADSAQLLTDNGVYERANLQGNVLLREPGKVAVGQSAQLDLQGQVYSIENVIYRLFLNPTMGLGRASSSVPPVAAQATSGGANAPLSGWGKASSVLQPPSGITQLKNVTYSTCPPNSRAWELEAEHLDLDQDAGRGYAYNAVMYAEGLPVFYTPYFDFPINNQRQTGFLYPQFAFGGSSGFGFGTPFYWNIAPNYDDTITPTFYTQRGFQFTDLFRYLTPGSNGSFYASVLPNDWEFRQFQETEPKQVSQTNPIQGQGELINQLEDSNSTRSAVSWLDKTQFTDNWSGLVNYTRVSDDYYLQDIGGVPSVAQNQLLQQGEVMYTGDYWNFVGNLQGYQTLHPLTNAVVTNNQYTMLPQLLFTSRLPVENNTLNYQWLAEFVNFSGEPNPGVPQQPPQGQRSNLVPGISLPLSNLAGYIDPTAQFELTQYNLSYQPDDFSDQITRALPIYDIDSGLYFQRDTSFFGKDYEQTLEPRIFYLYVPYRDQNDIPLFDSTLLPFSYDQLFLTNRFTGTDRIADANQMTFAVSTRYLDEQTGDQKFFAGVGFIQYFQNRRVTLCNTVNCIDSVSTIGSTNNREPTSPIAGEATYNFNTQWNASANVAWDTNNQQMQNSTVNFQYIPATNHIVNVGYSYLRYGDFYALPNQPLPTVTEQNQASLSGKYNLSEPTASFVWPLTDHWQVLGSWSYSVNQNHSLTYFYGVGYNSCCWAVQTIVARSFTGINNFGQAQYDTSVYVQWAFKGLATVAANDPTSLLISSIPGYQSNFAAV